VHWLVAAYLGWKAPPASTPPAEAEVDVRDLFAALPPAPGATRAITLPMLAMLL